MKDKGLSLNDYLSVDVMIAGIDIRGRDSDDLKDSNYAEYKINFIKCQEMYMTCTRSLITSDRLFETDLFQLRCLTYRFSKNGQK